MGLVRPIVYGDSKGYAYGTAGFIYSNAWVDDDPSRQVKLESAEFEDADLISVEGTG